MFQRISGNTRAKNELSILKSNTMNKEKIIDGIIVAGLILQALILIVLACLIFGFAPGVREREFIFNL